MLLKVSLLISMPNVQYLNCENLRRLIRTSRLITYNVWFVKLHLILEESILSLNFLDNLLLTLFSHFQAPLSLQQNGKEEKSLVFMTVK